MATLFLFVLFLYRSDLFTGLNKSITKSYTSNILGIFLDVDSTLERLIP